MKKVVLAALVVATCGAVGASIAYKRARESFRAYTSPEQTVIIPRAAATPAIGRQLVEAGVIRDLTTFRIALWLSGHSRRLQAGEYRFDQPMSAVDVLGKIARGDVVLLTLTFPEGLTMLEMAAVFETSGFGTADEFRQAARAADLIAAVDPSATDLEGYLFPDTYAFPRGTDARGVVRQMVDRFTQVLSPDLREAARTRSLSVRQLVTLASLVEKETGRPDERATIAGVYSNRLKIGMPLQCDPTVIYALQREGRYDGNIRRADLSFDSPYNTYRYPGLPPGPIAAPGREALEAAARPASVDYLYFVSRNDGSHEFARSFAEHSRNVRRYQVEYFREQRQREERGGS